jgi:hypothetical protein
MTWNTVVGCDCHSSIFSFSFLFLEISQDNMSEANASEHERSRWSSRVAFYFAAVGAAVGFGK